MPGQFEVSQRRGAPRKESPPATWLVSSGAWSRVPASEEVLGSRNPREGLPAFPRTHLLLEKSLEKSERAPRSTSSHHKMATELCTSSSWGVCVQHSLRTGLHIFNLDGLSIPSISLGQAENLFTVSLGLSLSPVLWP